MNSREYTRDEVQAQFLEHVRGLVHYWAQEAREDRTVAERLSGLAFNILSVLDGSAVALPGFVVAPAPHPGDRAFHIEQGENYYPRRPRVACDIGGDLHERFYRRAPTAEEFQRSVFYPILQRITEKEADYARRAGDGPPHPLPAWDLATREAILAFSRGELTELEAHDRIDAARAAVQQAKG